MDKRDQKSFDQAVRMLMSYEPNIYVSPENYFCVDLSTCLPQGFKDREAIQQFVRAVATLGELRGKNLIEELISLRSGKMVGWKVKRVDVPDEIVTDTVSEFARWCAREDRTKQFNKILDLREKISREETKMRKEERRLRRRGKL